MRRVWWPESVLLAASILVLSPASLLGQRAADLSSLYIVIETLFEGPDQIDERSNQTPSMGKTICGFAGDSSSCSMVRSIGEGLCRLGGNSSSSCSSIGTIAEGLCRAGGNRAGICYGVGSIAEALSMVPGYSQRRGPDRPAELRDRPTGAEGLRITGSPVLDGIIVTLLEAGLLNESSNENARVGREICYAGVNSTSLCNYVDNIGEGICYAGARSTSLCDYVDNIGEGICYAGVNSTSLCDYVDNIGEGICYAGARSTSQCDYVDSIEEGLAALPGYNRRQVRQAEDTQWAWDEINAPYGRGRMWRCRGIETGRFAEDYRCAGLPRVDYRWPGEDQ